MQKITTQVDWKTLGAVPEMLQTAWGSLFEYLQIQKSQTLLVRGGTTSVGLAAAAIAKDLGCTVASTSRSASRSDILTSAGADHVIIDNGSVADEVRKVFPNGADKVLELIGVVTLEDSLKCAAKKGSVCMTGIVGNRWEFEKFSPMNSIPSGVNLTIYNGGPEEFMKTPLERYIKQIAHGTLPIHVGKVYRLDEIAEAGRMMESNKAGGKIVVLT